MDPKSPHHGITMHRMPVGGNFPGLVFTVGSVLIFLFAIPALWFVLLGALAAGCVIAAVLQIASEANRIVYVQLQNLNGF